MLSERADLLHYRIDVVGPRVRHCVPLPVMQAKKWRLSQGSRHKDVIYIHNTAWETLCMNDYNSWCYKLNVTQCRTHYLPIPFFD